MGDIGQTVLSGSKWQELVANYNTIVPSLPDEIRKPLTEIFLSYATRFTLDGAYMRMNNRTLLQIIAEYEEGDATKVVSGQLDGVRFDLYEKQPTGNEV